MATTIHPSVGEGSVRKNRSRNGHEQLDSETLAVILQSLHTMRDGDFSVRLPVSWTGLAGKIADTFNDIVAANEQMARELNRVGQAVGKEGKTRERIRFQKLAGLGVPWRSRSIRWSKICCGRRPKLPEQSPPSPRET